jgi:hypothetical protein
MKPRRTPAVEQVKYLRQSLGLTVPQVLEKAIPIFIWIALAPIAISSLIFLATTNNYVFTERVVTLVAAAIIGILTLYKTLDEFLLCIAIYEANGQKALTAIRSAVHEFRL